MVEMSVAALITWLVAVGIGSYMVRLWLGHGGLRDGEASHFPPVRVFSHLGLAVLGLVVWITYLAVGRAWIGWAAFAVLVLVATLGGLLVNRWRSDGRAAPSDGSTTTPDLAEQHIGRL